VKAVVVLDTFSCCPAKPRDIDEAVCAVLGSMVSR